MTELVTILARGDGEFGLFMVMVVVFAVGSAVFNGLKKKAEEQRSGKPMQPPRPSAPRTPPVVKPRARGNVPPPLPRPVIAEKLPDRKSSSRRPPEVRGPARRPVPTAPAPRRPVPAGPVVEPLPDEAPASARSQFGLPPLSAGSNQQDSTRNAALGSQAARAAVQGVQSPLAMVSRPVGTVVVGDASGLTQAELRRAMVLNELLSPPVALRD